MLPPEPVSRILHNNKIDQQKRCDILKSCHSYAADLLATRKLGILNFLKAAEVAADEAVRHYLVAACDSNEAVSRLGEELLRKRFALLSTVSKYHFESLSVCIELLCHCFHSISSGERPALFPAAKNIDAGYLGAKKTGKIWVYRRLETCTITVL